MYSTQVLRAVIASVCIQSSLAAAAPRANPPANTDPEALLKQVQQAPTQVDKLNVLLPDPKDPQNFVYDFRGLGEEQGFPALDLTNVALGVGSLGACALILPHIHPRANEIFTVLDGTIDGAFVLEIGAGIPAGGSPVPPVTVNTKLDQYMGTIFPMGNVHWQFNPTCKNATHFTTFDSKDPGFAAPGVVAPANGTMNGTMTAPMATREIDPSLLNGSSVGPSELPQFRSQLQPQLIELIETCAAKCGLTTKN